MREDRAIYVFTFQRRIANVKKEGSAIYDFSRDVKTEREFKYLLISRHHTKRRRQQQYQNGAITSMHAALIVWLAERGEKRDTEYCERLVAPLPRHTLRPPMQSRHAQLRFFLGPVLEDLPSNASLVASCLIFYFNGQCYEIFRLLFSGTTSPGPIRHVWKGFNILLNLCGLPVFVIDCLVYQSQNFVFITRELRLRIDECVPESQPELGL